MRLISFALTPAQIRAQTKYVTRRLGWDDVTVGEHLCACEKIMGRRPGEPLVRICEIIVVAVRREPIYHLFMYEEYGESEMIAEGFPGMSTDKFADLFIRAHGRTCDYTTFVTRIQFRYLNPINA